MTSAASSVQVASPAVSPPQSKAELLKRILFRADLGASLVRQPLLFLLGMRTVTRGDLATNPLYRARTFSTPETVTLGTAHTPVKPPRKIEQLLAPLTTTLPAPFVCEVPDAELCGPRAVGFDARGRVILETTTPIYHKRGHLAANISLACLRERFRKRPDVPEVECASSLINEWSANYWHWIIDSLTRLEAIEHYAAETGVRPKLIIRAQPSQMQLDSLRLMGYGEADTIRWNRTRMRVKKLVISPYRRQFEDGVYSVGSPRVVRWVSERILANLPPAGADVVPASPRIFISRRLAGARRIANEEEVVAALEPLGFRSYTLESLPFVEQVRLFSQAQCIVAPHGAGLTNLLFAPRPTIVELFGPVTPRCYSVKARGLGLNYGYLRFPARAGDLRGQDADFVVDVPQLVSFVHRMTDPS